MSCVAVHCARCSEEAQSAWHSNPARWCDYCGREHCMHLPIADPHPAARRDEPKVSLAEVERQEREWREKDAGDDPHKRWFYGLGDPPQPPSECATCADGGVKRGAVEGEETACECPAGEHASFSVPDGHGGKKHVDGRELLEMLEEEEDTREAEESQRLRAERQRYLTPQCCEAMRKLKTVVAYVDIYGDDLSSKAEKDARFSQKPVWRLRHVSYQSDFDSDLQKLMRDPRSEDLLRKSPEFCPWCGEDLPDFARSTNPPRPLMRCTDGGYYCDECEERLNDCTCYPPWAAWEIRSRGE